MKALRLLSKIRADRLRILLLDLVLFLASFLLFFYLLFPVRALHQRLTRVAADRFGVRVEASESRLLFPLKLANRRITLTAPPPYDQSLTIEHFAAAPRWFSLLSGRPGLTFEGKLRGGAIRGNLYSDDSVNLALQNMKLQEKLLSAQDMILEGVLKKGRFSGPVPPASRGNSELVLELEGIRISGLEGVGVAGGVLDLGRITLSATGKGSTFRIAGLSARGGVIEATGKGSVLLGSSPSACHLNLTLRLHPTERLSPALRDLLSLLGKPGSDGSLQMQLTGTLANPTIH
jgi:type II secretion system protein N